VYFIAASYSVSPVGITRVVLHVLPVPPFDHFEVSPVSKPSSKIASPALSVAFLADDASVGSPVSNGSAVDVGAATRVVATRNRTVVLERTLFITAMPFPQTPNACAIA
jgi:hypothetical protein